MQEYKKFWQNLVNFNGRTSRREYWVTMLINTSISYLLNTFLFIACTVAKQPLFEQRDNGFFFSTKGSMVGTVIAVPLSIWAVFVIFAGIPLAVRRLHDIGKPGWVLALCYVGSLCCGIGAIVFLVFCFMPSKEEENQWGISPKEFNEYEGSTSIVLSVVIYVLLFILMVGSGVAQVMLIGYKTLAPDPGVRDAIMGAYGILQNSIDTTEDVVEEEPDTSDASAWDLYKKMEEVEEAGITESTGVQIRDDETDEDTGKEIRVNAEDIIEKVDPNDKRTCVILVGGKEIGVHVSDYVDEDDIFIYPEDETPYSYTYYLDKDDLNVKVSCCDSFIQEDTVMDELQYEYDYYKTDSIYEKFIESESGAPIAGTLAGHKVWKCKSAVEDDGGRQNFYTYYIDVGGDTLLKEEIYDYNAYLTNDEVDKAVIELIRTLGN